MNNLNFVILIEKERTYAYTKGEEIQKASGAIGNLRSDMGTDGDGFFFFME